MSSTRIEPGDIVSVNFNASQMTLCSQAEVIYTPGEPGESWVFNDLNSGELIYCSEPITVARRRTTPTIDPTT
jgi:hypothetical protein